MQLTRFNTSVKSDRDVSQIAIEKHTSRIKLVGNFHKPKDAKPNISLAR